MLCFSWLIFKYKLLASVDSWDNPTLSCWLLFKVTQEIFWLNLVVFYCCWIFVFVSLNPLFNQFHSSVSIFVEKYGYFSSSVFLFLLCLSEEFVNLIKEVFIHLSLVYPTKFANATL